MAGGDEPCLAEGDSRGMGLQEKMMSNHRAFSSAVTIHDMQGTMAMNPHKTPSQNKQRNPAQSATEFKEKKYHKGNVYMYYKLHGFHQNLHRYIQSRSNRQLMGKDVKVVDFAVFKTDLATFCGIFLPHNHRTIRKGP
ncbi:hypothetical protein P7K49_031128 [Saguinus oedipus]|uniref:Uncharacterized protein n=1 Tax=Saguinus oedipus TaxID=9490 RepID=A0ABQ9U461_SAGOE|nr:hypothetical protein P7K49_031128 [Saguinus oedipus]